MFLTVHGAIGVLIGQSVSQPILAFVIGFISHYIFDIIPHGDTNAPQKYKNPIHIGFAAIVDFILLIAVLIFLATQVNLFSLTIFFAVLGSLLPDLLQAAYFFLDKKVFGNWQKVHDFIHDEIIAKNFEWPFYIGIFLQILFLIILIFTII